MRRKILRPHADRQPTLDTELRSSIRGIVNQLYLGKVTQADRTARRKWLYHNDPIWRLTKNKDNRERRLRAQRLECGQ